MTETPRSEWTPTEVSHPGETLVETLEALGMTQSQLALRMGRPKKTINEIARGKAAIAEETAFQLEHVLGIPASFWLSRQQKYEAARARLAENETLLGEAEWLKQIPYSQLVKRGLLPKRSSKADAMRDALGFYKCGTVKGFHGFLEDKRASFRTSKTFSSDPVAVATWLRCCELEVRGIELADFSPERLRALLPELRATSLLPLVEGLLESRRLLASAGVALVWVEAFKGARLSGAAHSTRAGRLIGLTLRHRSDDHLWFTLFHELGHLLLHEGQETFIDDDSVSPLGQREREADRFARENLIPPSLWAELEGRFRFTEKTILDFAERVGVAPGVVVGFLQHDRLLKPSELNHLKRRMSWVEGKPTPI